ncbi:alpha/beta hydrolase [Photobacterium alginatilyticum]|uniref:Alpha/beta hydrolase n=1 Tax=Photobacterium alginatilyticum TaxID=1775171 RepID=A0ABW9YLA1_9GAMM|nr:hypothetical protein [Photobacterium alginatilyticum]NBI54627.1 hypothetical protein [Photobacterium alginatilyticum]
MTKKLRHMRFLFAIITTLVFLASSANASEPHHYNFPNPDGPYRIGFHQFEVYNDENWIQVSSWYPSTAKTTEKRVGYLTPALIDTYVKDGNSKSMFSTIPPSWTFFDLPIANGKHPVLIYNHGFLTFPRFSMTQLEYLASHGYIVLAISHPGRTRLIERKSGVLVPANYTPVKFTEEEDAALMVDIVRMENAVKLDEWLKARKLVVANELFQQSMLNNFNPMYKNNLMLIDALHSIESGNIPTLLKGHMDLDAVGAFGHSFGGNVSIVMTEQSPVIKAGVNLDGNQYHWLSEKPLQASACFFYADKTDRLKPVREGELYPRINDALFADASSVCSVVFPGSNHFDFTDNTYISDSEKAPKKQSLGHAINTSIKAYFDAELKKTNSWPPAESEYYIVK